MFKYLIYFILILLLGACGDSGSPSQTVALQQSALPVSGISQRPAKKVLPHVLPESPAVMQTSFEAAESRIRLNGATLDTSMARSGRTSLHLAKSGDTLFIEDIPVSEGQWYVINGYMYVNAQPGDVVRYYVEYMHGDQALDIPNYPMLSVPGEKEWQPFTLPVYIQKNREINHVRVAFRNVAEVNSTLQNSIDEGVWLDDISIDPVDGSENLFGIQPPSDKRAFNGALVRVDALGNFSLKSEEGFSPFLPVIIYPDFRTEEWGKYRAKGFNTVICTSLKEAEAAVREGMHWIWSLYDYGIYDGDEKGYARFEREYMQMRTSMPELFDKLLYFYWDNERYRLFDSVKHFSDTIKKIDVDENGIRYRPFLMQLDFATANTHYANDRYSLCDLQGLYANPMIFEDNDPQNYQGVNFKGNYDGEFANFAIFDHIPGVTIPKTVFVVNSPFGDKHLANTIFAAFARGGKAFAYWKDGGSQPKVETKPWWTDFNQTAAKMQAMLPLLRQPHWTSWDLNVSMPDDEDGLVVGKRDFEEKRCMIIASRSNKAERVRFGSADTQEGAAVIDYFSGRKVATWREGAFELQVAPRGYGAYCW